MVTVHIYSDSTNKYPVNSYSSRHYGYHCGGHPYGYVEATARDKARMMQDANEIPGATHYRTIDLAILPYPGKEGCFYLEDRSEIAR